LKGDSGQVKEMAQRLIGSPDIYPNRSPLVSVNFITAHDGFTLADLVSYNHKHNEANGENNRDGLNDNYSWNHGVEGETDDSQINALRRRQLKNAFAMLLMSQGVPLLLMGDEIARTQQGNNNAYCQDNDISWLNWSLLKTNDDLFNFVRQCIAFRKAHPALRNKRHLHVERVDKNDKAKHPTEVTWHGVRAGQSDWGDKSRRLAFTLRRGDDYLYVVLNMDGYDCTYELPALPPGKHWHVFANTGAAPEIHSPGAEVLLHDQHYLLLMARSVAILVGK
jgi:glycogen operon protein